MQRFKNHINYIKVLLLMFLSIANLNAIEFTSYAIHGTWELSAEDERGFVQFGKDRTTKRGETWRLEFKNREVINHTKGSVYGYYVANGLLNLYIKIVKQSKNYTRTTITHKSTMELLSRMGGMDSGCYLMKIQSNLFTQYKSHKRYKLCKVEDTPIPVYDVNLFNEY